MADGVAITAGAGTTIATDDVGGVHYQRFKLVTSEDGSTEPVGDRDLGATRALFVDPRPNVTRKTATSSGLTTATTAYVLDDQLGVVLEWTDAVRATGGTGLIIGATLLDKANIVGGVDLYLFNQTVTPVGDNAAADFSDGDMANCLGVLAFPTPVRAKTSSASNQIATVPSLAMPITAAATSLFGALVTRSGHTFFGAVGDLVVSLFIQQD